MEEKFKYNIVQCAGRFSGYQSPTRPLIGIARLHESTGVWAFPWFTACKEKTLIATN
jgi:hypothetical protein